MDKETRKQYAFVWYLLGAILVIDQIVKIWVKTHMQIGEDIPLIGDWCRLHFVENEGFAFGMKLGGSAGKIILTLFRLFASGALLWFILHKMNHGMRKPLAICLTMILAGAVGNLIDSFFYGLIFNASYYNVAQLFPPEGGYAPLLQGRVVDMFYFPLFEFTWPEWVPFCGGEHFAFFNAIFNVADAAITIGVIWILIYLLLDSSKQKTTKSESNEETNQKTEKIEA